MSQFCECLKWIDYLSLQYTWHIPSLPIKEAKKTQTGLTVPGCWRMEARWSLEERLETDQKQILKRWAALFMRVLLKVVWQQYTQQLDESHCNVLRSLPLSFL